MQEWFSSCLLKNRSEGGIVNDLALIALEVAEAILREYQEPESIIEMAFSCFEHIQALAYSYACRKDR